MAIIRIPLAVEEDAAALMIIATSAFSRSQERYGHFPHGLDSVEWHREQIDRKYCHVIWYGDTLVGGIYLDLYPEQSMKIEYFFISPAYQGRKIGTAVLQLIEEEYAWVTKWFLLTPYKDFENQRLYEKSGYAKVRELKPDKRKEFTLFEYEKLV